jgi:hypothetical protein
MIFHFISPLAVPERHLTKIAELQFLLKRLQQNIAIALQLQNCKDIR